MTKLEEPTPEEVIRLREASGMSCAEFGALVHASEASVYAWESGRRGCSVAAWELLLIYFGLHKPRTLLHTKPRSTRSASIQELQAEVIHKRIKEMYSELSALQKERDEKAHRVGQKIDAKIDSKMERKSVKRVDSKSDNKTGRARA